MQYLNQVDYAHGPYAAKKGKNVGRKIINLQMLDGRWRPVSYPKFLVEVVLGRELDPFLETIDHIDGDFHNNSWSNLRVLDQSTHSTEDAVRVARTEIVCVWCGAMSKKKPRLLRSGPSQGRAGPFCTRRCAGIYSTAVQNNKLPRPRQDYVQWDQYVNQEPVYYTVTKFGETVADIAVRLGLNLPTEAEILMALPRRDPKTRRKPGILAKPKSVRPCFGCATPTTNKKFCSSACTLSSAKRTTKIKWPAKEKLQRLVWKYPTSYIAKRLGVSDVAVAKHCKKLGINKPPRGYWMKQRAKKP